MIWWEKPESQFLKPSGSRNGTLCTFRERWLGRFSSKVNVLERLFMNLRYTYNPPKEDWNDNASPMFLSTANPSPINT